MKAWNGVPRVEYVALAKDTWPFMGSCHKVYDELGARFYGKAFFHLVGVAVAVDFVEKMPDQFRHLVTRANLTQANDKLLGKDIQSVMLPRFAKGLPALRELWWHVYMEDDDDYGILFEEWWPYCTVRKILVVLNNSPLLEKVICNNSACFCDECIYLRLTDANGMVTPNDEADYEGFEDLYDEELGERELDIHEEHQKWLRTIKKSDEKKVEMQRMKLGG